MSSTVTIRHSRRSPALDRRRVGFCFWVGFGDPRAGAHRLRARRSALAERALLRVPRSHETNQRISTRPAWTGPRRRGRGRTSFGEQRGRAGCTGVCSARSSARRCLRTNQLSAEEISVSERWIDEGAEWPDALANEVQLPPQDPAATRVADLIVSSRQAAALQAVHKAPAVVNGRGPEGSTPFDVRGALRQPRAREATARGRSRPERPQ